MPTACGNHLRASARGGDRPPDRAAASYPSAAWKFGTVGVGGDTSPHYCIRFDEAEANVATYRATVEWKNDGGFLTGAYSRAHILSFDGGASVHGSSSPSVVPPPMSDPTGVDPEEALIASASACHMLWFLSLAQSAGLEVAHYRDDATGRMGRDERGRMALIEIVLRPALEFAGDRPAPDALKALHDEAHEKCFIANSLRTAIRVEAPAS